jgi:GDP-L-fucose synthase
MDKSKRIYVAGHTGLVGSSLVRHLTTNGYTNIVTAGHDKLDLTNKQHVEDFFYIKQPDYVINAAARVGGIHANDKYSAEFIYQNLSIQTNIIDACHTFETKKLMFLGSVCIYPKYAPVPVKEEYLLTGELEPTNQWYATAKIAGIKMCQAYRKQYGSDFVSVMPCNLYGEGDNFHLENSHVIPALLRKFLDAKAANSPTVTCWGTGAARREFLYVDDMADACEFLMNNYSDGQIINIGFGEDYTIKELVELVAEVTEYKGEIVWDTSKPDGTPKRILDTTRLFNLGWRPKISLREGLTKTLNWYKLQTETREK